MMKEKRKKQLNLMRKTFVIFMLLIIIISITISVTYSVRAAPAFKKNHFINEVKNALERREINIRCKYDSAFTEVDVSEINNYIKIAIDSTSDNIANIIEKWEVQLKGNSISIEILIKVDYSSSIDQDRYVEEKSRQIVERLMGENINVHQKIKKITDYVARNVQYDHSKNNFTAYDALKYGQVTCQGYALLTYHLLEQAGFENKIIHGVMAGEKHAWNLININGYWYHLDLTQIASEYHTNGSLFYNDYLLHDRAVSLSHSWKKQNYPSAVRAYVDQLKAESYFFRNSLEYKQFRDEINLFYLKEKFTAKSISDLERKIKNVLERGEAEINLRLYPGILTREIINNAIKKTLQNYPEIAKNYSGWKFNVFPRYSRDVIQGTGVVRITFTS